VQEHPSVCFRGYEGFTTQSFVPAVMGDEPGSEGGMISGCNQGVAYVAEEDIARTVCINGRKVVRDGDPVRMNALTLGGQHNTIGEVYYKPTGGAATKVDISESGEIEGDTNPLVVPETKEEQSWLKQHWNQLVGEAKKINQEYKLVERGMSVLTIAQGVGEGVVSLGLFAVPEPTMVTKAGGIAVGVHALDTLQTGFRQFVTGNFQDSLTKQAVTGGAKMLGVNSEVADTLGNVVDSVPGLVNPAGAATKVIKEGAEETTEKVIKESIEEGLEKATKEAAEKLEKESAEQASKEAIENATENAGKKGVKQAEQKGIGITESSTQSKVKNIDNPVIGKPRVESANKIDPTHSFNDIVDNYAGDAAKFDIPTKGPGGQVVRTSELYQLEGSLRGKDGVFEWIVDQGNVTHRRFIPSGNVTGFPNQVPRK
jgi:flagellar biosynthesis/type III secretory pathway protein FliH